MKKRYVVNFYRNLHKETENNYFCPVSLNQIRKYILYP